MSYILAIESAIYGGSAALLKDETVVGEWIGTEPRGSSDQLLPNIKKMIEMAGISRRQLNVIAVSNGPGSYTGIRIGIATALGLAAALGIDATGISILEAMALSFGDSGLVTSAIPFGRDQIAFQTFNRSSDIAAEAIDEPEAASFDQFISSKSLNSCRSIVVNQTLYERLADTVDQNTIGGDWINAGHNLALAIGRAVNKTGFLRPPEAIYVRN